MDVFYIPLFILLGLTPEILYQPAMFITFEGIEGSGKSTQARLFADALKVLGHDVLLTREPGGTSISNAIRTILLDPANKVMVPDCEHLLYWAARAQHVAEKIKPALERGQWIICDRFVDSTLAYQIYGRGLDPLFGKNLQAMTVRDLVPQKTFLLNLDPALGLERARERNESIGITGKEDRFEAETLAFHQRVHLGFLDLAAKEPKRFCILDATQPRDAIHKQIMEVFQSELLKQ